MVDLFKRGPFNLASIRRKKGLTQKQIAKSLGVASETVSRWERGERFPRISLSKLATALNCTPADLLTEPRPSAITPADELAEAEAQLVELEAKIARLKAEVGHG